MSACDIINNIGPWDWRVIGWYTPDYRHLAQKLANQLCAVDACFHIYAVPRHADTLRQITRQKPEIMLRAMTDYPGKTLVLMDVDTQIHGRLDGLFPIRADVAHWMKARPRPWFSSQRGRMRFHVADRVIAFSPTEHARRFCAMWAEDCKRDDIPPKGGSEWARSHTVARARGVTFEALPERYAGLELGKAGPDAVVVHVSETARRKKEAA
jgi:hypothetical protein